MSSLSVVGATREGVPVKISVTLEFDRPEFPDACNKVAMAKKMSLERNYANSIQAMVAIQVTVNNEDVSRYQELLEQLSDFTANP